MQRRRISLLTQRKQGGVSFMARRKHAAYDPAGEMTGSAG